MSVFAQYSDLAVKPTTRPNLTAIIASEDASMRELLKDVLARVSVIEVIAECQQGGDVLPMTIEYKPNLLFLDGHMSDFNTFEVVSTLQTTVMPKMFFVTPEDREGNKSLKLHAFDCTLKPLNGGCLSSTTKRAGSDNYDQWGEASTSVVRGEVQGDDRATKSYKQKFSRSEQGRRKLVVKDSGTLKVVPFDEIDFVEAAGDYMCVHTDGGTLVMRSTLRDLMEKLDSGNFARIHRSTIVNTEKIVSLTRLPKGEGLLEVTAGKILKVSRNYRDSVRYLFQNT